MFLKIMFIGFSRFDIPLLQPAIGPFETPGSSLTLKQTINRYNSRI